MDELQSTESLDSVPPPTESPLPPKKKRTFPIFFFILIGIVISGFCIYSFARTQATHMSQVTTLSPITSPTPTPIIWQTYTDSDIGFSIQYPEPKNPDQKNMFPVKQ